MPYTKAEKKYCIINVQDYAESRFYSFTSHFSAVYIIYRHKRFS